MMQEQIYLERQEWIHKLENLVLQYGASKLFVVCGEHCSRLEVAKRIREVSVQQIWFSQFSPNPRYEDVENGVALFKQTGCKIILAIGGGSTLDVAKCIKLFASMETGKSYLCQEYKDNDNLLIALPTTAGSGSEATKFAVIYHNNEKYSVEHESLRPEYVILEPDVLKNLPDYQKKVTMVDALCHAIESYWSIYSTEESRKYAKKAIQMIWDNMDFYLMGEEIAGKNMMFAANYAGMAINITKTTAAHAMSYKVTSLYNLAHGHAAMLCLPKLWAYMQEHLELCVDDRGVKYVSGVFHQLAEIMGCISVESAVIKLEGLIDRLELEIPIVESETEWKNLVASVNQERLRNTPVKLQEADIEMIYKEVLGKKRMWR